MNLPRRQFLYLAAGTPALPAAPRTLWAQTGWPERPTTLTHGFAAGGGVDTTARILADSLSRRLRQPVVVESKPGAGTTLAAARVKPALPHFNVRYKSPVNRLLPRLLPKIRKIRETQIISGV